ncbi:Shufflon-specific DNA recombinase [Escherichia coli]|uniref:Shufflon-specific DNA recombinase n=1 Tax=Escherichia coli TaxID=562 RepID=A0A376VW08_ECOLX|nr:Shufflon-specific DNA recombinase [Escherichia coli]
MCFSYTSSGFKSAWRIALLDLKIENLHFHDLRHEAISRLFELGTLNVMEIAAISGHRSPEHVETVHTSPGISPGQ